MLDLELAGKTALITGTNNPLGIGAAAARAFATQGVRVFLHYYRTSTPLQESHPTPGIAHYEQLQTHRTEALAAEICAAGGEAAALELDLADRAAPTQLFAAAEAFGPIDILINNAAHSMADTLLPGREAESGHRALDGMGLPQDSFSAARFDRHLAVNARAAAELMHLLAQQHIQRAANWGRIINVSTDASPGFAGEVSYGASKYALESLSRAAAVEFGPLGITVNVACLGPIQTGWMQPELESQAAAQIPLGRIGQPQDVADVLLLLASEQARWLTGQILYVGGGHRMI